MVRQIVYSISDINNEHFFLNFDNERSKSIGGRAPQTLDHGPATAMAISNIFNIGKLLN